MIFFFCANCVIDISVHFVFAADFLQHVNHAFVGAAVQRPFQRADG